MCITIAANIAETAVLGVEGCFPDSVIGMVPNLEVTSADYVEYMLRFFAVDLKAQGKGSAQDNINLGTFERSSFPFPDLHRQNDIVDRLNNIADEAVKLRSIYSEKIENLDELRRSILQKAFAGELT